MVPQMHWVPAHEPVLMTEEAQQMANTSSLQERRTKFLARARKLHGRRYSYDLAEYVNNKTPIVIICRNHDRPFAFSQIPHDHLKGQGCPNCGQRSGSSASVRAATFTARAATRHGDRYEYSAAMYVDAHTPIVIICPRHGSFEQRPTKHLQGSGCTSCARPRSAATRRRAARRRLATA